MPDYFVNKNAQNNGDHQIHRDGCRRLPAAINRESLGFHNGCQSAVTAAKLKGYSNVNGCAWCARECHAR